jgi:23S rRNA (adenine2503-C2)-methyltransferase
VSTAGHLKGYTAFLKETTLRPCFALSLHSPFPEQRAKLMPIEKVYPVYDFMKYCSAQGAWRKNKLFIQYTLIKGVNDSLYHAKALVELLGHEGFKLNLIPFNSFNSSRLSAPDITHVKQLQKFFLQNGIRTMIRFSKASDVAGACGQLVT